MNSKIYQKKILANTINTVYKFFSFNDRGDKHER